MNSLARFSRTAHRKGRSADHGKLKIGGDWNAIRNIGLSQSNPLKAIADHPPPAACKTVSSSSIQFPTDLSHSLIVELSKQ